MTFGNLLGITFGLAATATLVLLCHSLDSAGRENARLEKDLQTQTQARQQAEWLLDNQTQILRFFAAIRAANLAARQGDETQLNESKKIINEIVTPDDCSVRPVPAAAADELHRLEDYARSRSGFATAN